MCLSSITSTEKEKPLPNNEYHMGWKVVDVYRNRIKFSSLHNACRPLNTWLYCKKRDNLRVSVDNGYPTGFHIFTTRSGARSWKKFSWTGQIVKVRYRRVVARGMQTCFNGHYGCIVAKEIYVEV